MWLFVCLPCREAIDGGLRALKRVIPGGDTFMNLGLEMVRTKQRSEQKLRKGFYFFKIFLDLFNRIICAYWLD